MDEYDFGMGVAPGLFCTQLPGYKDPFLNMIQLNSDIYFDFTTYLHYLVELYL